jgi:hypothetical protein
MPGAEGFGDQVEAHLLYALDLPGQDALDVLAGRLEDGSWRLAADRWAQTLGVCARDAALGDRSRELITAMRLALVQGPLDVGAHAVLRTLSQMTFAKWSRDDLAAIATWFASNAVAGDSTIAADLLALWCADPDARKALTPVATWLIANGASELRAAGRALLAFDLVPWVAEHGEPADLVVAIRYVHANEGRVRPSDDAFFGHLAGIELAFSRGEVDFRIVDEMVAACDPEDLFRLERLVREADPRLPRLRAAIVDALCAGCLAPRQSKPLWQAVATTELARRPQRHDVAIDALHSLDGMIVFDSRHPWSSTAQETWVFEIASALLSGTATAAVPRADAMRLSRIAGYKAAVRGVLRALRCHVDAYVPDGVPTLVHELLREDAGSGSVMAALLLLARDGGGRGETASDSASYLADVAAHVRAVVRHAEPGSIEGTLLSKVTAVEFTMLEDERKVELRDGRLYVDETSVLTLTQLALEPVELALAGAMYVVHELVHEPQGIGDKSAVASIRAAGAESTLMHLDLGADHAAARSLARATEGQSLAMLKDLQGRSLAAFPYGPTHSVAARGRKSQRLVDIRLDYLVRRQGLVPADANYYVFGDYGPAGGEIMILASGQPWRLLATAPLSRGAASICFGAAGDRRGSLAELDAILLDVLDHARSMSSSRGDH